MKSLVSVRRWIVFALVIAVSWTLTATASDAARSLTVAVFNAAGSARRNSAAETPA